MKAALISPKGEIPQYADYPKPKMQNDNQLLIAMKAAAIKNIDKSIASGQHYSKTGKEQAKVVGSDGVGIMEDGTKVYALGVSGMIAEYAVIEKDSMIKLPAQIDDAVAAALPNAVAGSAMALRFRANIQSGETILINGATGFTGKIAVQIAKHYGAKRIIATGRNPETLKSLLKLGADEVIRIEENTEKFISQIKEIHFTTPIDVVIDYLWGHSAEMIMTALKGKGGFTHRVRFVSIGSKTGDKIQLSAEFLRSSDVQLSGSGLGSLTRDEMRKLFVEILPEMLQLAADGQLKVEILKVNLRDINRFWNLNVSQGQRLVVMI